MSLCSSTNHLFPVTKDLETHSALLLKNITKWSSHIIKFLEDEFFVFNIFFSFQTKFRIAKSFLKCSFYAQYAVKMLMVLM